MDRTLTHAQAETRRPTAEELCSTYAASVCRFAALMSPGPQDAEDLVQEALIRAVRSLGTYDPARGSLESWLWRIVANAANDAAGARQRLRDVIVRVGIAIPREAESVEDAALDRLRDEELHVQLLALPLRDRTVLALRFGLDLELDAVGAAVGLSSDSARKAMRRALARLRARLEDSKR